MGREGIAEFKEHPFFAGIAWDTLHDSKPPYIPKITSPTDTSNFDQVEGAVQHVWERRVTMYSIAHHLVW
jgi:hypothetical protein